jgi:hypothetical protein
VKLESGIPEAGEELGGHEGLYFYSASERLAAGEWLYWRIKTDVEEQLAAQGVVGGVAEIMSNIADDVANQMLNTFARDESSIDAKDSEEWRAANDAQAVSPDNLLSWDPPDQTSLFLGLWGYSEPLVYRAPRIELVTVHKWKKVAGKGTVTGITRIAGDPQGGVRVELNEHLVAISGLGDVDGGFVLEKVPAGEYELRATVVKEDPEMPDEFNFFTANVPVAVVKDQTTSLDIELRPPSPHFREVVIEGLLRLMDWEFGAPSHPWNDADCFRVVHLGDEKHRLLKIPITTDESVYGELLIDLTLQPDDDVRVVLTLRIFADETDEELENDVSKAFTVEPGTGFEWNGMWCTNSGSDRLELDWIKISNRVDVS